MRVKYLLFTLLVLSLTACGFKLRYQTAAMPFDRIYIAAENAQSGLVKRLKKRLQQQQIQLADQTQEADVTLRILNEQIDKRILSLAGSGRVNEFILQYTVEIRAFDAQQNIWIEADELSLQRDFSYDDDNILAKQSEEAFLIDAMQKDMVHQILQRLNRSQPGM